MEGVGSRDDGETWVDGVGVVFVEGMPGLIYTDKGR